MCITYFCNINSMFGTLAHFYLVPNDYDTYQPPEFSQEELDSLKVPFGEAATCKNYWAERNKWLMVIQQYYKTASKINALADTHCGYYQDQYSYWVQKQATDNRLSARVVL